jgi:hypothetical protein
VTLPVLIDDIFGKYFSNVSFKWTLNAHHKPVGIASRGVEINGFVPRNGTACCGEHSHKKYRATKKQEQPILANKTEYALEEGLF